MYDSVIYFCDYESSGEKDEYGDDMQKEKLSEVVFAREKSIGQSEFYQAQTAGVKPEIKLVIADYLDYTGQQYLIYGNMRYKVFRTYKTESNELEITCYGGVRNVNTEVGDKNN